MIPGITFAIYEADMLLYLIGGLLLVGLLTCIFAAGWKEQSWPDRLALVVAPIVVALGSAFLVAAWWGKLDWWR